MEDGAQTNLPPKGRDNENSLFQPPLCASLSITQIPAPNHHPHYPIHDINVYCRGSINSRNAPHQMEKRLYEPRDAVIYFPPI